VRVPKDGHRASSGLLHFQYCVDGVPPWRTQFKWWTLNSSHLHLALWSPRRNSLWFTLATNQCLTLRASPMRRAILIEIDRFHLFTWERRARD
jgi:hypothetical protein